MSNLQPFQFDGAEIRFVGSADVPEWVAGDIVTVLYPESQAKDRTNYLKSIPSEWKGMKKIHTLGGGQEMTTVFEAGLYSLIARSSSPIAVRFQKWVFEDVLPSIRKTGSYSMGQADPAPEVEPERWKPIAGSIRDLVAVMNLVPRQYEEAHAILGAAITESIARSFGPMAEPAPRPNRLPQVPQQIAPAIPSGPKLDPTVRLWILNDDSEDTGLPCGEPWPHHALFLRYTAWCQRAGIESRSATMLGRALVLAGAKMRKSGGKHFTFANLAETRRKVAQM